MKWGPGQQLVIDALEAGSLVLSQLGPSLVPYK